jgi:hypothetical protein
MKPVSLEDFLDYVKENNLFPDMLRSQVRKICEAPFKFIQQEIFDDYSGGSVNLQHVGRFIPRTRKLEQLTENEKIYYDEFKQFITNINNLKEGQDESIVYRRWYRSPNSRRSNSNSSERNLGERQE